jgi:hypothetical protein
LFISWSVKTTQAQFSATGIFLAIPEVSVTSPSQSLLIIAGIFGLFEFIFSIYLATQIGDSKAEFSIWFLIHPFYTSIPFVNGGSARIAKTSGADLIHRGVSLLGYVYR